MITVFYDGICSVCAGEISHYQRHAPMGAFLWCDIARDPAPLQPFHISQATALRRLHAVSQDGQLHIGVAAFILIWRQLGLKWRLLAMIVSLPGICLLLDCAYSRFADYRFARLSHCQAAATGSLSQ